MPESEPFSMAKWFSGWADPRTWGKAVIYGLMIGFLLLAGFTIYRAFFMKTGSNTNKPEGCDLIVLPGAKTGAITQTTTSTNVQKSADDKRWEVGIFGGGVRLGDDDGFFGGGELKFKF